MDLRVRRAVVRHTFYRMFCESCTVFADGTALVDGEERITYAQLFEGVESEAAVSDTSGCAVAIMSRCSSPTAPVSSWSSSPSCAFARSPSR